MVLKLQEFFFKIELAKRYGLAGVDPKGMCWGP